MLDAVTEEPIRVRYAETDRMGHAYYGNYLAWLEQARGAWCRDRGFTYAELEGMGYFLPVVEVNLKYRDEVRYDDLILVRVRATEIRRSAIRFDYELVRAADGRVCSEGFTWHVLMGEHRRAVQIPPDVRAMMDRDPAVTPTRTD